MISVDEAVARIAGAFQPLNAERAALTQVAGRVLAQDVVAAFDQPPAPMSAMDGYAVRVADAKLGAALSVVGQAPAGKPFGGKIGPQEAVRIFTGGVVPEGADAVVLQEDVETRPRTLFPKGGEGRSEGAVGAIIVKEVPYSGENVRPRGLDFRQGDMLLKRGHRITARDVALLAAADLAELSVIRKPRIALVATGDELSHPGEPRREGGIVASSIYAIQRMVEQWGGEAVDLGILPDKPEAFAQLPEAARGADLVITQGGASVGDHDLVKSALLPYGFALDFWKIQMRPGKPLIFGRLQTTPLLGLPGNPVSAMVCSILFVAPAIAAMLGTTYSPPIIKARLASSLRANGKRQDYIRVKLSRVDGVAVAEPFMLQDSSMQKIFAYADALVIRLPFAPPANAGEDVDALLL